VHATASNGSCWVSVNERMMLKMEMRSPCRWSVKEFLPLTCLSSCTLVAVEINSRKDGERKVAACCFRNFDIITSIDFSFFGEFHS
jgi:hypothetical protein